MQIKFGESLIAMLKMLALLRNRADLIGQTYPLFENDEFYYIFSNTLQELILYSRGEEANFFESQTLADYVLE